MSYDREKRTVMNSKGAKTVFSTGIPATGTGNNGEERIIKAPNGKLRLYRKELGAWYYLEFTRS